MAEVPPVRRRLVAVGLVAAVVAASGFGLSRGVGPRKPGIGGDRGQRSGALFCPHGGSHGWHGWVVIANPGSRPVNVRITPMGTSGPTAAPVFSVPPLHQVYREIPATDSASATEIEYFGGWVGAAAVIRAAGGSQIATERCVAAPRSTWFLSDESTGPGESAYAVVMNPFAQPAEFNVVIRTEKRTVQPGPLTPYVLPPYQSVGLQLNKYLLQAQDEHTVTAEVVARAGRVVAGELVVSAHAVRAEAGISSPHAKWFIPAAGYTGPAEVTLINPRTARTDLAVMGLAAGSQRVESGPNGLSLAGDAVRTFRFEDAGSPGIVVQSMNGQPMVASLRVLGSSGDSATMDAAAGAYRRWLVLPSLPPSGGNAYVVLQNPGTVTASVTFRLIGSGGPPAATLQDMAIPPGRTIRVPVRSGPEPLSVLITARSGTIVAGSASISSDGAGFAATLGVPVTAA